MKRPKSRFFLLTLALVLALAPAAFGQYLLGVGEINPYTGSGTTGNGFPKYVEADTANGPVKLDLPVPPLSTGAATQIFDPPLANNPFTQHVGFGEEAFFFYAESKMDIAGGDALLVLGVEAAYGAEVPMDGDQFLFARTRIRIDTPTAGTHTYRVIHPWGVDVFPNVPQGRRAINFTFDWGGFAPIPDCDQPPCLSLAPGFERILKSPKQGPFLVQLNPPPPPGWIGDGINAATVTGGVDGVNYFRVERLDSNGNVAQLWETQEFLVSGHIFQESE